MTKNKITTALSVEGFVLTREPFAKKVGRQYQGRWRVTCKQRANYTAVFRNLNRVADWIEMRADLNCSLPVRPKHAP